MLIERKPEDLKPLEIVQPNSITNARYDFSAVQENILTCIFDALQKHMSKEKLLDLTLFGSPIIRIDANEISKHNDKSYVMKQLVEMRKKSIDYNYTDKDNRIIDVHSGLINGHKSLRGTSLIDVHFSELQLPYFLYWGKGIGGTLYSKTIALTLKSIHSKRIYKLCKKWENKGGFSMSLDEFKARLEIKGKLDRPAKLKKTVLEVAKMEIEKHGDIAFNYGFHKVDGSRSFNHIKFKIFSLKGGRSTKNGTIKDGEWYQFLYRFLAHAYPHSKNNKAQLICDQLSKDIEKLKAAYDRFAKMDDDFSSGQMEKHDIIPLTKYILKNDFGVAI